MIKSFDLFERTPEQIIKILLIQGKNLPIEFYARKENQSHKNCLSHWLEKNMYTDLPVAWEKNSKHPR